MDQDALVPVMFHEMAHALGFADPTGTSWTCSTRVATHISRASWP